MHDSLIIVSTYLPPDEESGRVPVGSFLTPEQRRQVQLGKLVFLFSHNQRLGYTGLKYAYELGIEYSLSIRSDVSIEAIPRIVQRFYNLLQDATVHMVVRDDPEFNFGSTGDVLRSSQNHIVE